MTRSRNESGPPPRRSSGSGRRCSGGRLWVSGSGFRGRLERRSPAPAGRPGGGGDWVDPWLSRIAALTGARTSPRHGAGRTGQVRRPGDRQGQPSGWSRLVRATRTGLAVAGSPTAVGMDRDRVPAGRQTDGASDAGDPVAVLVLAVEVGDLVRAADDETVVAGAAGEHVLAAGLVQDVVAAPLRSVSSARCDAWASQRACRSGCGARPSGVNVR